MPESQALIFNATEQDAGKRLDVALSQWLPDYSRVKLQACIKSGSVWVNDKLAQKPNDKLCGQEQVRIALPAPTAIAWQADTQAVPLSIVYQDEAVIVLDKPVGVVVHPGAGHRQGTLLNRLLHDYPELAILPRAGIVHRLDKDTSGLLVVARTQAALNSLSYQLQKRTMKREYAALVSSQMIAGGTTEAPLGRHPTQRTKMAVVGNGKTAITDYRIAEKFREHTLLTVQLQTGRTHQIRVHMAHIGFPLVGDKLYGYRLRLPPKATAELIAALRAFDRQALHAKGLQFKHPEDGRELSFSSPLPQDFKTLLAYLREDTQAHHARY